jgi:hypothetical protein
VRAFEAKHEWQKEYIYKEMILYIQSIQL